MYLYGFYYFCNLPDVTMFKTSVQCYIHLIVASNVNHSSLSRFQYLRWSKIHNNKRSEGKKSANQVTPEANLLWASAPRGRLIIDTVGLIFLTFGLFSALPITVCSTMVKACVGLEDCSIVALKDLSQLLKITTHAIANFILIFCTGFMSAGWQHNHLPTKEQWERGIVEHIMRHVQFTSTCCRIQVMGREHVAEAREADSAWIKQ